MSQTDSRPTMEVRMCDDDGMVSHARVEPPNAFAPDLTYYGQLNNLRRHGGHKEYSGEPFVCTGHAHLAGHHIKCTSPAHQHRDWHGPYDDPLVIIDAASAARVL